jgi:hypothetical protein
MTLEGPIGTNKISWRESRYPRKENEKERNEEGKGNQKDGGQRERKEEREERGRRKKLTLFLV